MLVWESVLQQSYPTVKYLCRGEASLNFLECVQESCEGTLVAQEKELEMQTEIVAPFSISLI